MTIKDLQKAELPDSAGVYTFKKGRQILYIGKATSLKSRVRSYFSSDIREVRSPLIEKMVEEATSITFEETDSVLEALILEAHLIKKHQPVYNSREKDDKSFNYVTITKEEYPRLLVVRGKDLETHLKNTPVKYFFGPFPKGGQFKEAMKLIRKMFPYFDTKYPIHKNLSKSQEKQVRFNQSIKVYPETPLEQLSAKEYGKTIKHLKLFFEGKKKKLISELEKEMAGYAKKEEFEKAEKIKRQLFALTHIQDVSLIKDEFVEKGRNTSFRIEAYDIAHTSGKQVTGVMTVVEGGEAERGEYRKFKIKEDKNNDTQNLKEVLLRRLAHPEWQYPRLIVVDGGLAQINIARKTLKELGYEIPVVGVVKDERHRPKRIAGDTVLAREHEKEIVLANAEAHRFAISYHRKRRDSIGSSRNRKGN